MRPGLATLAALLALAAASCRPPRVADERPARKDPAAEPRMVRLDFKDRPVFEVVEAIAARGGYRVALDEDARKETEDRRITLENPEPVPFWEAMDRLERAANLQVETEFGQGLRTALTLSPGRGVRGPTVVVGLFRCQVIEVHRIRTLALGAEAPPNTQGRPVPTRDGDRGPDLGPTIESLRVRVRITPEPRGLRLMPAGEPRVTRAVDDRGRSMTYSRAEQKGLGALMMLSAGTLIAELPVAVPQPEGTAIASLEAVAPLDVAGTKVDLTFKFANLPIP